MAAASVTTRRRSSSQAPLHRRARRSSPLWRRARGRRRAGRPADARACRTRATCRWRASCARTSRPPGRGHARAKRPLAASRRTRRLPCAMPTTWARSAAPAGTRRRARPGENRVMPCTVCMMSPTRAARLDHGQASRRRRRPFQLSTTMSVDGRQDLLVAFVPGRGDRHDVDDRDVVGARDHRLRDRAPPPAKRGRCAANAIAATAIRQGDEARRRNA